MAGAGYHLRQAIGCLRQAPGAAMVAAATVAVALAVSGSAFVAGRSVETALASFGADARVTIFLPAGTEATEGAKWASEAAAAAGTGAVGSFHTPDEALAKLRRELGDSGVALDALATNPLPPTIEVRLSGARVAQQGLAEVRAAAARVRALPFAGDLEWGEGFVDRLEVLLAAVRAAALLVFALVLAMTLFLVGNVVRLTVYARREEIEILRLVGATDGFISAPFVLEGAIQGLGGGLVGMVLAALVERWALPEVAGVFGFGPELLASPMTSELLVFPGVGLLVGVVASLTAALRFLRAAA